jgi:hypothetical protein
MRKTMNDDAVNDKSGGAHSATDKGTKVPNNFYAARVMQKAQAVLGAVKTAFSVSKVVGVHERTAKHWKADSREMDMTEFMKLAKSRTDLGAELFGLLWNELPEATRELWDRQRALEEKSRVIAAQRRKLEEDEAELRACRQTELKFSSR